MDAIHDLDFLVRTSLSALAADPHVRDWSAKENNWVNYFVFRYMLQHCRPGSVISQAAQFGIEVGVPQPARYKAAATRRDIVIWPEAGMTCWDKNWNPSQHPLAIIEWKVHRLGRKNRSVGQEREWLRVYCRERPSVVAYAVEVNGAGYPMTINCSRFFGSDETPEWLELWCE